MQTPQTTFVGKEVGSQMLAVWLKELKILRKEHALAARYYEKLHWKIGLPSVGLAAVLGASIWSVNAKWPLGIDPKMLAGLLSIVVLLVNAAHTFLRADERSSRHKVAFDKFDALYREGEYKCLCVGSDEAFEAFMEDFRVRWQKASEEAPTLRASTLVDLLGESNLSTSAKG